MIWENITQIKINFKILSGLTKFKINQLEAPILHKLKNNKNIFKKCLQEKDKSLYLHLLKQREMIP